MQVGPRAKKNKLKKLKKEGRAKEKKQGELVEEVRAARRTANEKLVAELRLITAAAARLHGGRDSREWGQWSSGGGDAAWGCGPWEGGGGSSSSTWQPRGGGSTLWQGGGSWGGRR